MSDSAALRLVVDSAWKALNTSIYWNGFTFTFGEMLVFFIAIVIVGLIIHFFV